MNKQRGTPLCLFLNSLSLDNTSLYEMTADSDIKSFFMSGGTVKFVMNGGRLDVEAWQHKRNL